MQLSAVKVMLRRWLALLIDVGQKKKGPLSDLWVHKFRDQGQLYLPGYTRDDSVRLVYLKTVGLHKNLYHDLKR